MSNFCPNCGTGLTNKESFCPNCGIKIPNYDNTQQPADVQQSFDTQKTVNVEQNVSAYDTKIPSYNNTQQAADVQQSFDSQQTVNVEQNISTPKKNNKKKIAIVCAIAGASVILIAVALIIVFSVILKPVDLTGEYSLTSWIDEDDNSDFLEYWADKNYVIPYKLVVKDNSDIRIMLQNGQLHATLNIDYSDLTGEIKYVQNQLNINKVVLTISDNTIKIYDKDYTNTFIFEKQPINAFDSFFDSQSSVDGELVKITTYEDDEIVNLLDKSSMKGCSGSIKINSDGTGECKLEKNEEEGVFFSLNYNQTDMTCSIDWNDSARDEIDDGYITIYGNTMKIYDTYYKCTLTFIISN